MTSREQRKHLERITPYNERFYHHIEDYRTLEQKQFQANKVSEIFQRNLRLFGIEMTEKKKIKYQSKKRFKLDLGDGWYCNITDNKLIDREYAVITVHGAPGDHKQWAGLEDQMQGKCRWINLTIPGFDQQDQRRGTYIHNSQQFAQMIVRIIKKLQLKKVIYCGHSLGSIYAAYFLEKYPQYIEGYINVTGIVNHWYTGLIGFFYKTIAEWNLHSEQGRKLLFSMTQQQRKSQHKKFLEANKQYYFGPAVFPELTQTQYFGYIKLFNTFDHGISENYRKNMDHKLLRVNFFGRKDPLHIESLTDASLYYSCFAHEAYTNSAGFKKILNLSKKQLEQKIQKTYGAQQFKAQKIQQYFTYHFEDTGHNAHKRRPKQMAKVLNIYVDCLSVFSKYKKLCTTKL